MKKISLCLHDVRASDEETTIHIITKLMQLFNAPLTVHLIVDTPLDMQKRLDAFLHENIKSNKLEIVFHGLTHSCSRNNNRWLSFYHKYQAEYYENNVEHQINTQKTFEAMRTKLGQNIGICPPCWLSTNRNNLFFQSLNPLYIEAMFSLNRKEKKQIFPIISIGSPSPIELCFLRLQARLMYLISLMPGITGTRVVIHVCDTSIEPTMIFFTNYFNRLIKKGFMPVFQRDLLDL